MIGAPDGRQKNQQHIHNIARRAGPSRSADAPLPAIRERRDDPLNSSLQPQLLWRDGRLACQLPLPRQLGLGLLHRTQLFPRRLRPPTNSQAISADHRHLKIKRTEENFAQDENEETHGHALGGRA